MRSERQLVSGTAALLVLFLLSAQAGYAQRTELEPGFNIFSPEDDIQMGREVAREAEQELSLVDDELLGEYVNRLGQQLAMVAPFERYPYQFKLVNDRTVNAFALPGGFIYINRGIIELADREAELAGVIAHEIGHVALRHGTNQASKAYIAQAPLAILGGLFGGGGGVGSILTQLGIGFGANSIFLKFSRDAERQADLVGAQILYDAGYDPTGMAEFFEKMEAEGGGRASEFFSSHPNPGNRLEDVADEIQRLGERPATYYDNFSDFRRVKERLGDLPEATPGPRESTDSRSRSRRPDPPSSRYQVYQGGSIRLVHPENWEVHDSPNSVTFAPPGGIAEGEGGLGYGLTVSRFEPEPDFRGRLSLEDTTDQLIRRLRQSNPSMRINEGFRRTRLDGWGALAAGLLAESPFGGVERDWLLTTFGPGEGLYYFIAVAPDSEFDLYRSTFETILDSVRFR